MQGNCEHSQKEVEGKGDLEQDSAVGINVGPWVLGLAVLGQDSRGHLVDQTGELDKGVILDVLQRKLSLSGEARVGFAEHRVAISRNNLP